MNVSRDLIIYFDLGILPEKPMLGRRRKPKARERLLWTILMYVGVVVGVFAEYISGLYGPRGRFDFSLFDPFQVVFALIIATLIFPQIFPKVFGKMKIDEAEANDEPASVRYVVQFCVAFQNGFFWQALVERIVRSISGQ